MCVCVVGRENPPPLGEAVRVVKKVWLTSVSPLENDFPSDNAMRQLEMPETSFQGAVKLSFN